MKQARLLVVSAIVFLLTAAFASAASAAQCVKFDSLAAGTTWGGSAGHVSGDVVHAESGILVSVRFFQWPTGGTLGDARVDSSWQTSPPNSVNTNNVNLGFDFTGLSAVPSQVAIKFRDLGGFENLSVNGSPVLVGELMGGSLPGLTWTVADFPTAGGREGKLTVQGAIHSLVVGGQEFWLDTLCVTSSTPEGGLDHFKVYDVPDLQVEAEVKLRGQFDREVPKAAKLVALSHFANPVSKNGEGIVEPNAHLSFYRIRQEEPEPGRSIGIRNQFGRQTLRLDQPVFLAVPAEKIEDGSRLVRVLDHFKCYEARGEPVQRRVTLRDQFLFERGFVAEPRLFCVPVEKWHRDDHFEIFNREAHLTFYELKAEGEERKIRMRDQFTAEGLAVQRPELLGVPTVKLFTAED